MGSIRQSPQQAGPGSVLRFVVWGDPITKGRPRFSRGRTFTPPRTVTYEMAVRMAASVAAHTAKWRPDADARFVMIARIYRRIRNGDVDNYLKALADGGNKTVWPDDRQILAALPVLLHDKERPRVEVEAMWMIDPDGDPFAAILSLLLSPAALANPSIWTEFPSLCPSGNTNTTACGLAS